MVQPLKALRNWVRSSFLIGPVRLLKSGIKTILRPLEQARKRSFFMRMQTVHRCNSESLQSRKPLKVIFLVIHSSVWKVDTVFARMVKDPAFDPIVLIVPNRAAASTSFMRKEMSETHAFFEKRGIKNCLVKISDEAPSDQLDVLNPDIVFFTNPHPITDPIYYNEAFKKYLSCYVPYHHEVVSYGNDQSQYNQMFHNAMWKIFVPHKSSYDAYKRSRAGGAENVEITGYPASESLLNTSQTKRAAWKPRTGQKKRIIWAPHHTIDNPFLPLGNFLKFADFFQKIAFESRDEIQWAFKPHPMLHPNLCAFKNWGPDRTDSYYKFWQNGKNTQLETSGYDQLFKESDAIIHDSSSFLAEYLYLNKPSLYLQKVDTMDRFFNAFGRRALQACVIGKTELDILNFITDLLNNHDPSKNRREKFMEADLKLFFEEAPSDRILKSLKKSLGLLY